MSIQRYVTHGYKASILACELRGESHESLACHAANLTVQVEQSVRHTEDLHDSLIRIKHERDALLMALRTLVASANVCGDMDAPLFTASLEDASAAIESHS